MTFLNGLLAAGSLAFIVPLAIHLLFRSRFTVVDWGAMHLLDGVIRINRRRIRWSHWLLLCLRCLIPILLAFCLARPVLTGFQALSGGAPQSLVIVVDDSRSMAARGSDGTPRIERLKQGLAERLAGMSRQDEVMLVPTSRLAELPSRMGKEQAVERVRQLTGSAGPADLALAMEVALNAVKESPFSQRRILLASDFQSRDLDDGLMGSLQNLDRQWQTVEPRPIVSFWNLGGDADSLTNLSIDSIEVESPAIVAGRTFEITTRVHNASDLPASNVAVTWLLDGNPFDSDRLSLTPRGTAVARTSHQLFESGVHELSVAIEIADALPEDNRRRLAVEVIEEIEVLLVDGQPGSGPLQGETDFLSIALSPFAFAGQDQVEAVRTRVIRREQIASELAVREPDVVLLANVASLDPESETAIATMVRRGGSLVVFDGDQLDPSRYNRPWGSDEMTITLPAELGERVGDPRDLERGNATLLRIAEPNPQFTPWALLRQGERRPMDQVGVVAYRNLQPQGPAAMVLLELAGGQPLVVSQPQGLGRVVQFAIPGDPEWSSLPLRPIFVPLMQQLMLSLARSRLDLNVKVGEPIRVPLEEFGPGPPEVIASATFTVEAPGENEVPSEPVQGPVPSLVHAGADQPGVYRFRRFVEDGSGSKRSQSTLRVAEVGAEESQLRDAPPDRIEAFAASLGGKVYTDLETLRSDETTQRFGREIWRWLLLGLLGVMAGELLVAQGARRRLTGVANQ